MGCAVIDVPQVMGIGGLGLTPGLFEKVVSNPSELLKLPQAEYQLRTFHNNGVYLREFSAARGVFCAGHEHKTSHFNIIAAGECLVVIGDRIERMVAPYTVVSGPGVSKVILVLQDIVWYTIHANPDNCRDEDELARRHVVRSDIYLKHKVERAEQLLKKLGHLLPKPLEELQ
jgi:hypothetical protein